MSDERREKSERSKKRTNRTPLDGHKFSNKKLVPPFVSIMGGKLQMQSWTNERLPEMIWAALILASLDRDDALGQLRSVLNFIGTHDDSSQFFDLTISGIAKLEVHARQQLLSKIATSERVAKALAAFLLFEQLPAKEDWEHVLCKEHADVELLMYAVGRAFYHQSQEATDCRWVRLMAAVLAGRMQVPWELSRSWFEYPHGDQKIVRPSIRASEMSLDMMSDAKASDWPCIFWDECWTHTDCMMNREEAISDPLKGFPNIGKAITEAWESINAHWDATHRTTAIDARHDAAFGIALYALRLFVEIVEARGGTGIIARLGLRTMMELLITLKSLLDEDNEDKWKKWRQYGTGQAKLASLRTELDSMRAEFIDGSTLEKIAGEDLWEELVTIDVGNWDGSDLRKVSIRTDQKSIYDKYYSWTSGYAHGNWGAVREACFENCGNPLHRLHRYPHFHVLPSVLGDAIEMIDALLEQVNRAYPGLAFRFKDVLGTHTDGERGGRDES